MDINDLDDDGKLYRRYSNKKVNAKKEGINFYLTFDEFKQLMRNGGYKSSNLGFTGDNIVLARFKDSGDYTIDNCRFTTHKENIKEKNISSKSRMASSRNITEFNKKRKGTHLTSEQLERYHNTDYYKRRQKQKMEHEAEKRAKMNPSYMGERNSQFGTFWITNGVDNRRWKEKYGEIPIGYYRGRVV